MGRARGADSKSHVTCGILRTFDVAVVSKLGALVAKLRALVAPRQPAFPHPRPLSSLLLLRRLSSQRVAVALRLPDVPSAPSAVEHAPAIEFAGLH